MFRTIWKSVVLLFLSVIACCILYPLALWAVGQTVFPFQANGSMLAGPDGKPVGSKLIAQPFTKDEYFQPRPSACTNHATASASTTLSTNNYQLRDRVARSLAPVVKYKSGPKAGNLAAPDVEIWFQKNQYQGKPDIVSQWAGQHGALATAWVKADPSHGKYVEDWEKTHADAVAQFIKDNPATPEPQPADLGPVFFGSFATEHPGMFPVTNTGTGPDGKPQTTIDIANSGSEIQSTFFLMWREENPDAPLQDVPGDMVTTSASGLDPHITMENALFQLDRVSAKWADDLKRDPAQVGAEIKKILDDNAQAPWAGLIGEQFVNVLEVNLELTKRFGQPS